MTAWNEPHERLERALGDAYTDPYFCVKDEHVRVTHIRIVSADPVPPDPHCVEDAVIFNSTERIVKRWRNGAWHDATERSPSPELPVYLL